MSPFANTLTNWKKEIINIFIIVDDKANRKMNTAIVENRNKSIKLLQHASNGYLNWERFPLSKVIDLKISLKLSP